jgi:ATP-dependent helicase HrpB
VASPLPIDEHLASIVDATRDRRVAVVVAPPGAGKTTRVPPALLALGRVVLLQPRRVAARSIARRIALESGSDLGREVGWQVRFDRRFGADTRLLVATEGVLTARLRDDPLLEDFDVVVLDEFHERTVHADLALAFVRQALAARDDLRVVVMSATLDAGAVASFLDGAPVVEAHGSPHDVAIEYAPSLSVGEAVRRVLSRAGGNVLCFLPGAPEIRRVEAELRGMALPTTCRILPLHGALDADSQDAALAPSVERKVILATNIAETSLTVEGTTDVIDTGLQKVMRCDPASGLDRLETERVSLDAASRRAGRAGRTGPGRVLRLWDPREELRKSREAEISRVDLAGPALDVLAWGGTRDASPGTRRRRRSASTPPSTSSSDSAPWRRAGSRPTERRSPESPSIRGWPGSSSRREAPGRRPLRVPCCRSVGRRNP